MAGSLISPEALQDLQSIQEFIALDNPNAAEKIIKQLFAAFETLQNFHTWGTDALISPTGTCDSGQ